MRKEDPTLHLVARDVDPSGGVHWLSETEVALLLLRDGRPSWHRVSLKGSETPLPVLTSLGLGGYECDVRQSADGIWSWVANRTWRTSEGKSGTLPGTCSVSLSLDGKTATSLHDRHKEATLTAIRPGGINATLWWSYDGGFDNHRWTSNHAGYIVAVDEHHQTMVVMTADGSKVTRMGTLGRTKHGMYGDFTVGNGIGAGWPTGRMSGPGLDSPRQAGSSRLEVEARLLKKRPIPQPETYPNTLVVYDYQVQRVSKGRHPTGKILVVHWGIRRGIVDRQVGGRVEGRSYRLLLEPFEDHTELHGLKLVENLEDLTLPLYLALSPPS